jgi:hypothetical protein
MVTPREIFTGPQYETIRFKAILIPYLVRFALPDGIKETMPLTRSRELDGDRILRFYATPSKGDIISFRGILFKVLGLFHEPMPRGSKRVDKMPIVITEYFGAVENDPHN